MNTEPQPTPEAVQAEQEPVTEPQDTTDPPVDEPPVDEPEPEEDTTTPPPPESPSGTITFEPATWYSVDTVCLTQDKGNGQPCPNLNVTTTDPMVYSNAGKPIIVCGMCNKGRTILAATKLDPQPVMD
ncbi:hypothetical protein [Streptomyces glaucescens]|uniref:hypothetical protein n=1 Tax=Streptomyces glaucescens TaxID=1907 RepID=UPI000A3C70DF|nr:hypothetical protein [Streptomyces glaucescens]